MDRRSFVSTAARAAAALAAAPTFGQEDSIVPRIRARTDPPGFRLLEVSGTPRERGRQHGEALRTLVREACEGWKEALSRPEGTSPDAYVACFLKDTTFREAMALWTPDLLEEIEGIAEGSGLPADTVFAMQLVDEEWCYASRRNFEAPREKEKEKGDKCSVVAVARSESGPTLVAQNIDTPGWLLPRMVLMRAKPEGDAPEALVVTVAGMIALNGMNRRGVAVAVNALLQCANADTGLPVAAVIRGALARNDLASAARFVESVKHASGQCYTLGDPAGIACLEASAGKVVRWRPDATRLAHTNHPFVNDDLSALGKWAAAQPAGKVRGPVNSARRHEACDRRLGDPSKPVTVDVAKDALGSHDHAADPVCRHPSADGSCTVAATVFELGAPPRLHLASNPPCAGRFDVHGF